MMMIHQLLEHHHEAIAKLAEEHHVLRLEVFGSTAKGNAAPDSDVDLLVEFEPLPPARYAEHYFALQEALEKLLGKPVDLIETTAITNPYFLEAIAPSRVAIYGA